MNVGQILPRKKNLSQLWQVGVVGYDQWQITENGGTLPTHTVGGPLNYIPPARNFSLFFKFYYDYESYSHTLGNTIVFGGAWTPFIPKPPPLSWPRTTLAVLSATHTTGPGIPRSSTLDTECSVMLLPKRHTHRAKAARRIGNRRLAFHHDSA